MTRFARCVLILLLVVSPFCAAQEALRATVSMSTWNGNLNPAQILYTHTRGAAQFGSSRLAINLSRQSNPAPAPPYMVRAEISRGILNVVPVVLPAGASCQPMQGGGDQPTVIECLLTSQIAGTSASLQFALDTGSPDDFGGPSASARVTVDYAAFPLPAEPTCMIGTSETGCVQQQSQVFTSSLDLDGMTVVGGRMTMGQNANIRVEHSVSGFDSIYSNQIVIDLPAGLEYLGVSNVQFPTQSCSASSLGEGQRVTCSSSFYSFYADGGRRGSAFNLIVRPGSPLQVPGPVRVVAAIGNSAQPMPQNCAEDPSQSACEQVVFDLDPAPFVDLQFTDSSQPEPWLLLEEAETLRVDYRNAGTAAAPAVRVVVQLPPDFGFVAGGSTASSNACSASGSIATGQRVLCVQNGMPAASTERSLNITIRGDRQANRVGNVVLYALTDGSVLDSDVIVACDAEPAAPNCLRLQFDAGIACLSDPVHAIYCDGYEALEP